MNKYFTLVIIVSVAIACSRDAFDYDSYEPIDNVNMNECNSVSLSDAHRFARNRLQMTKTGESIDYSIQPYIGKNVDTLMYIINYECDNGWTILSSDTRTPAIIAESSKGRFSLESDNPGIMIWMDAMADDMTIIKNASDEELNFTNEEIYAHKSFWSKQPIRQQEPFAELPDGHWDTYVQTETEVLDTVPHMAPQWDQWDPYNEYSPLQTSGLGRAPAGCVAIAGAQALYVIHERTGYPASMCSFAICNGNIYNHETFFYDWSLSSWELMSPSYKNTSGTANAEAAMIAWVGNKVLMEYSDSSSSATTYTLKTLLFNTIGIECSYGSYNDNIVKTSLLSNYPVIVKARNNFFPFLGDGHCFLIDGYRRTRIKTTTTRIWVPNDPEHFTDPFHQYDNIVTITYSSPEITSILINWGWWDQWTNGINDGFYSLTGSWHVIGDDGDEYYDYSRYLIYNFSVPVS